MILKLYNTLDSSNVIGKDYTLLYSMDINLKNNVDITNPILTIMVDDININDVNYCEIVELNRLYLIVQVERVNNRIVNLHCECDVLETYSDDIKKSKSRYRRNIKTGDYLSTTIDFSTLKKVTRSTSDKGLTGDSTFILTTMAD